MDPTLKKSENAVFFEKDCFPPPTKHPFVNDPVCVCVHVCTSPDAGTLGYCIGFTGQYIKFSGYYIGKLPRKPSVSLVFFSGVHSSSERARGGGVL